MARENNLTGKYCLDDMGIPYEEPDLLKWGAWMERNDRTVAKTAIGNFLVSTVFLGLDHSWGGANRPLLYETMIFEKGKSSDLGCERYSTRSEALVGHKKLVNELKKRQRIIDSLIRNE